MGSGRIRQQLQDRQRADGFSGAGFSDQRHALATLDLKGNMVDRDRGAARLMKRHRQIADVEQRLVDRVHAAAYRNVFRGSNASRTASPMKISSDSMMATAKNPVKPSHGAWTLALPCDSNSPSDGDPGGNPKPRKSSAVSVITDEDTMKGRNVMVATMAFGSRCRNMITALDTPSARARIPRAPGRPATPMRTAGECRAGRRNRAPAPTTGSARDIAREWHSRLR